MGGRNLYLSSALLTNIPLRASYERYLITHLYPVSVLFGTDRYVSKMHTAFGFMGEDATMNLSLLQFIKASEAATNRKYTLSLSVAKVVFQGRKYCIVHWIALVGM